MTPGMDGDVVLAYILCLEDSREGNCTRPMTKKVDLSEFWSRKFKRLGV